MHIRFPSSVRSRRPWKHVLAFVVSIMGIASAPQVNANILPIFTYIRDGVEIASEIADIFHLLQSPSDAVRNPPVSVVLDETARAVRLSISGGTIFDDASYSFMILGHYWTGTMGIGEDAGLTFDTVGVSGNMHHTVGPDSDDGLGRTTEFVLDLSAFFPPPFTPSTTVTFNPNLTLHPQNNHFDTWSGGISATITVSSDITSWTAHVDGDHISRAIAEPDSMSLLALAIVLFALFSSYKTLRFMG